MFWKLVLENWVQCVSNIMQGGLAIKPVEVQHLLRLSFISKEATSLFEKSHFVKIHSLVLWLTKYPVLSVFLLITIYKLCGLLIMERGMLHFL